MDQHSCTQDAGGTPGVAERIREMLRQPGALDAALGYYRALRRHVLLRGWPLRSRIGSPPQPTLYLHGDEDGCIGVEFAVFARELPAGAVRSEIVGGAGHFLHLERPDEVSDLIWSFLRT